MTTLMSTQGQDAANATQTENSPGDGAGTSAPGEQDDDRTYNSQPDELRATDSDQEHKQSTDRDASAGWRAEMQAIPGVQPEGWRR